MEYKDFTKDLFATATIVLVLYALWVITPA